MKTNSHNTSVQGTAKATRVNRLLKTAIYLLAFIIIPNLSYGQNLKIWSMPPYTLPNPYSGQTLLPTAVTPPTGSPLGYPYNGEGIEYSNGGYEYATNAMYDNSGNLLFFIVDGTVYDGAGNLIGDIVASEVRSDGYLGQVINGNTEWLIVPVPNSCTQYYLIGGMLGGWKVDEGSSLYYITLDMSLHNPNYPANPSDLGAFVDATFTPTSPLGGDYYYNNNNGAQPIPISASPYTSYLGFGFGANLLFQGTSANHGVSFSSLELAASTLNTSTGQRLLIAKIDGAVFTADIRSTNITPLQTSAPLGSGYVSINDLTTDIESGEYDRHQISIIPYTDGSAPNVAYKTAVTLFDAQSAGANHILVLELDEHGDVLKGEILQVTFMPKGLAFSPDGNSIFVTVAGGQSNSLYPIIETANVSPSHLATVNIGTNSTNIYSNLSFDFLTGIVNSNTPGAEDFRYSQIEPASDGNLALATHNRIAEIQSPNLGSAATWHDNVASLNTPTGVTSPYLTEGNIASSYTSQSEDSLYNLPNQIIGENYGQDLNANAVCCEQNSEYTIPNGAVYPVTASATWSYGIGNNPWNITSGPITIGSNATIEIEPGATLTINNMTLKFAPRITTTSPYIPGGRMVVDAGGSSGGSLIINGTTLTSDNDCANDLWEGVLVNGISSAAHTSPSQGKMTIANNSLISNAYIAIHGTNGSNIVGANSTFKNNQIAYQADPYATYSSNNNFTNCGFFTTSQLVNPSVSPLEFVSLNSIVGVYFKGCAFEDTYTQPPSIPQEEGIVANSSTFDVVNYFAQRSLFRNLIYGINAMNTNANNMYVVNTDFKNNWRGIYTAAMNNNTIQLDTFLIALPPGSGGVAQTYGLYLDNCTGYSVQGNSFMDSISGGANSYGIVVSNSGTAPNMIYRNHFHNLAYGIQAQRLNCTTTATGIGNNTYNYQGLQMYCNNFYGTIGVSDIYVPTGGIDNYQGVNLTTAGNRFTSVCTLSSSGGSNFNDYYINPSTPTTNDPYTGNSGGVPYINYISNSDNVTVPSCATIGSSNGYKVRIQTLSQVYTNAECPSTINTGIPVLLVLSTARLTIQAYKVQLDSANNLLTAGNAPALYTAIATQSPGQVNNTLLAASPYLSDSVLITATKKGLPNGIIKQILIANSPLTNPVMSVVNAAGLPKGIYNNIASAQTGTSVRSDVAAIANEASTEISLNEDLIVRTLLNDTLTDEATKLDSAIAFMNTDVPHFECTLVADYLLQGNYTQAQSMMSGLQAAAGMSDFCKMGSMIAQLQQDSNNVMALKSDTTLQKAVSEVATDTLQTGSMLATGLMREALCKNYNERIDQIDEGDYLRPQRVDTTASTPNPLQTFKLYPNPNNGNMTLEYNLGASDKGELDLYDFTGRQLKTYILNAASTTMEINESNLSNGIYFYRVLVNNSMLKADKLVIVK